MTRMRLSNSSTYRSRRRRFFIGAAAALIMAVQNPARAATIDIDDANIVQLQAAMSAGTLTAERLVQLCLARIEAYDKQGPKLRAILAINPHALEIARALDAERKAKGPRSAIHGIPVVLKDNYNTTDMPTTGGSVLLEGSIPSTDAFVVKKLRDAGSVILAKANMSEFASGGASSSMGGMTLNPHDLARSPSGSSGGTGAAIAASYAPLGMGSDTSGSIRGPASVNGVVALNPTHGLLSRTGIIPLALSFDTGGPFARNVSDLAAMLSVMVGVDPADAATKTGAGKSAKDYTKDLNANALKGARLGIARDFMGQDSEVDWVIESAISQMKAAGATVVDVRFPKWMLDVRLEYYNAMRFPEFAAQIGGYLATLGPKYPKSLNEMIQRAEKFSGTRADGAGPNPGRWNLFKREAASGTLQDYSYLTVRDHGLPLMRQVVEGVIASNKLDAIIYPTSSNRPALIAAPPAPPSAPPSGIPGGGASNIASLTGFPDLIVPAGFTADRLPVGLSFMGTAYTDSKMISLGYSFEQTVHARRRPGNTPALAGDMIPVP